MESELISSETVRPSSPTPENLRTYTVSLLDHIIPHVHVPIVLFFPNTKKMDDLESLICETSQQLKRSLSVTLTRFYPLAGRLNENGEYVDCNDNGVPFVVAKFRGHMLCDLLRNPLQNSPQYFISELLNSNMFNVALKVQISYFDCGGVVIGALFSHRLGDGLTIATFMQCWASVARGSEEANIIPSYIAPSMFPATPKEEIPVFYGICGKIGKPVMRRYVFEGQAISRLRSKSGRGVERPTRVEVVSALIWKCVMVTSLCNYNYSASLVSHSVNLRRRAKPPIPSHCFGNLVGFSSITSNNEGDKHLGELVTKLRGAINKVDHEFVNKMKGEAGVSGYLQNVGMVNTCQGHENVNVLVISSWCGFGIYNVDFGWGKPIWVSGGEGSKVDSDSCFVNMVWLMDTRNGGGIEAWVVLDQKDVFTFENVDDFRTFASIDPSPLDM